MDFQLRLFLLFYSIIASTRVDCLTLKIEPPGATVHFPAKTRLWFPAEKAKLQALGPWWFIDAHRKHSTGEHAPARGGQGARGGQRTTPMTALPTEGEGPGGPCPLLLTSPRPPNLIHATETADRTAPYGYKRGDQLSHRPLTEIWPCWPAGPFCPSSQKSGRRCGGCPPPPPSPPESQSPPTTPRPVTPPGLLVSGGPPSPPSRPVRK